MDFENYGISEKYKKFAKYGDSLHEMGEKIDWESLRPIFLDLYVNDTVNGGRPNIDPIIMVKVLFIQSIYNLVDEQVEKEMHDRISMMHFLGFPDTIPDSRTIWLFRERLSTTGKDRIMWKEIWKQFEDHGIKIPEYGPEGFPVCLLSHFMETVTIPCIFLILLTDTVIHYVRDEYMMIA